MYFKIEQPLKTVSSSKKKPPAEGNWYFVRQKALVFKDGESYPDKYNLTLLITDVEATANAHRPLETGEYVLPDHAFDFSGRSLRIDEGALVKRQQQVKAA